MATPAASDRNGRRTISDRNNTPPSSSSTTTITSSLRKQVFLHDWWLIKPDFCFNGKQLGIGGFNSRERQGMRVFHSAPIVKRHDTVTLETSDGITVTVSGLINRSRTLENGFVSQHICSNFLFGFPYNWEEFSAFGEESSSKVASSSADVKLNKPPLVSIQDLPATAIHDIFFTSSSSIRDCLNDCYASRNQEEEKISKVDYDAIVPDATPTKRIKSSKIKEKKVKGDNVTSAAISASSSDHDMKTKVEEKQRGNDDANAATSNASETLQKIIDGDTIFAADYDESPARYTIQPNSSSVSSRKASSRKWLHSLVKLSNLSPTTPTSLQHFEGIKESREGTAMRRSSRLEKIQYVEGIYSEDQENDAYDHDAGKLFMVLN